MIDGDPAYGAPVSTDLTGMTIGVTYYVSFYQSSNQETSNTAPSNDNWEVFLINGADQGTPTPTNPVFTSAIMANAGKESTPWEEQTFSFVATAASETLEFLENASANTVPPMLDLADVSVTTPEPGTWVLVLVGAGLVFAGNRLRRRPSAYKPADRG
jgi:hypothetical protein